MKRIGILFLACILPIYAFPQDESWEEGYFGMQLGPSMPLGKYNSEEPGRLSSGYADPNYHFDVMGARFFTRNLGMSGKLGWSSHDFNDKAFIKNHYSETVVSRISKFPNSSYTNIYGFFGFTFKQDLANKLELLVRANGGLIWSFLVGGTYSVNANYYSTSYNYEGTSFTAGYDIGAGLRYNVVDMFNINFNTDFYHWKGKMIGGNIEYYQPYSQIQFSLGFSFDFGED